MYTMHNDVPIDAHVCLFISALYFMIVYKRDVPDEFNLET